MAIHLGDSCFHGIDINKNMRKDEIHIGTKKEILEYIYSKIDYNPDIGEHFHYLNKDIERILDKIAKNEFKMGMVFYAEPNIVNIEYSLGMRDNIDLGFTIDDVLDPSNHWKIPEHIEPTMIASYINVQIIE